MGALGKWGVEVERMELARYWKRESVAQAMAPMRI
jgi:hypothetical protein